LVGVHAIDTISQILHHPFRFLPGWDAGLWLGVYFGHLALRAEICIQGAAG